MLFSLKQNLEESVVDILTNGPALTAIDLHSELKKRKIKSTIQGVYKVLRLLIGKGVVFKNKNQYNLYLPWVLTFINRSAELSEKHITPEVISPFIPEENRRIIWKFNKLSRLIDFWINLDVTLLKHVGAKEYFTYAPHPWYRIITKEKVYQYMNLLKSLNIRSYAIIGEKNYMDKLIIDVWQNNLREYSYAPSPFHKIRDKHIHVIGDYIITVNLGKKFAEELDNLFAEVKNAAGIITKNVAGVLRKNRRTSIKLEHNHAKATILRKRFANYFGLRTKTV